MKFSGISRAASTTARCAGTGVNLAVGKEINGAMREQQASAGKTECGWN